MSSLLALAKLAQAGEHQTGMEEVPSFAKLFAIPNVYANIANFVHFEKNSINWLYYRPQSSCGKVIFSQVSVLFCSQGYVYPSMHLGRRSLGRHAPPGQTPHWADTPWADTPWADTPWADTPGQTPSPGRHNPGQTPPPRPPGQIPLVATAADGTHPTGMHSR